MMGEISILNVGTGDIRVVFDNKNVAETIRAQRIVIDLLKRGYALLVEVERDGEKRWERAVAFDETKNEYVIVDDTKLRNVFWSWKYRTDIVVWESKGKIQWGPAPTSHHLAQDPHTMGCADAWSLETEFTALAKLRELVSHHHLRQYLLAGMFIETSKRTGIKYIFRRLRPTVAIREEKGELRILCCLCLHSIAYYEGTWAGAMCPTDDILAHLMLMRGDEPMFWKRSNQIPAHRPEAGL